MTTLNCLTALLIASLARACSRAPQPVTAAPLAAAESRQLRQALLGTWKVVWIEHDGQLDRDGELTLTFTQDGQNRLQTAGAPTLDKTYPYAVEGRNIHLKNGPFSVLRADAWDDRTLPSLLVGRRRNSDLRAEVPAARAASLANRIA